MLLDTGLLTEMRRDYEVQESSPVGVGCHRSTT
jgi:hypothetical protein